MAAHALFVVAAVPGMGRKADRRDARHGPRERPAAADLVECWRNVALGFRR